VGHRRPRTQKHLLWSSSSPLLSFDYATELCAKELESNASRHLVDAQSLDVYRGTNAVIIMVSPFTTQSLDYAR
jgi:hypothetical protein